MLFICPIRSPSFNFLAPASAISSAEPCKRLCGKNQTTVRVSNHHRQTDKRHYNTAENQHIAALASRLFSSDFAILSDHLFHFFVSQLLEQLLLLFVEVIECGFRVATEILPLSLAAQTNSDRLGEARQPCSGVEQWGNITVGSQLNAVHEGPVRAIGKHVDGQRIADGYGLF